MGENVETTIKEVCRAYGGDSARMMDIVRDAQQRLGHVSGEAMELIARECKTHRVEVESVVSFYAFLSKEKKGKVVIRLCNDVIDKMYGAEKVAEAFKDELGIDFGETTADGMFTLEHAPCMGLCDQPPAVMVNDKLMTWLSSDAARRIVQTLKETDGDVNALEHTLGDGNNAHDLVRSMVANNIRKAGPVLFAPFENGTAIHKAIAISPAEVIRDVKTSRLRGRGGAGFPTGMKWEFTRAADGDTKYVMCNADEGEPGTFKDRVILTEAPHLLFEGMAIAGYAVGAREGILYLRGEYAYLRDYLEACLKERRDNGWLGENIMGKEGFNFDIRIQMGAGAYICGEETALISSCEGLRGDPKNRPPFPAQKGYKGCPTTVNNVETLCAVARILNQGPAWFAEIGSEGSSGTKAFSISGDCKSPGVYELPFGVKLSELLKAAGGEDAQAVQVGGPSGQMVGKADFEKTLCYDDMATGGSIMVFGPKRNVLEVANEFMEFFVDESCGYCTPCRAGNILLKERLEMIIAGKGQAEDLDYLEQLGNTVKTMSRCGLGQTSANPVLSTLKNFRAAYEQKLQKRDDGLQPSFDIKEALSVAEQLTERKSVHFTE